MRVLILFFGLLIIAISQAEQRPESPLVGDMPEPPVTVYCQ